jgi:sugar phosphate isomerase/epimerase
MFKSICFDYKYDSSPAERLRLIKEAGFDGVYVHSQYNPVEYIDLICRSTLKIESLHLPYKKLIQGHTVDSRYVNVLWESDDRAAPYVDELIHEILFAHEYGIEMVVMHVTSGDTPPPMHENGIRNIAAILDVCEKYNIILCLENLRRLDYLDYAFDSLRSDKLMFCFDSGHANCMTHNLDSFPWSRYVDKLCYLHLNDNNGVADQHLIPFTGNINWEKLAQVIHSFKRHLSLTLEVRSSAETRRQNSEREYLKRCFDSAVRLQGLMES